MPLGGPPSFNTSGHQFSLFNANPSFPIGGHQPPAAAPIPFIQPSHVQIPSFIPPAYQAPPTPIAPPMFGNNCGCTIQPATHCTSGPAIGARNLETYMKNNFGGTRTEIFNCRDVRGGATTSLHGEGRAVDFYANKADGNRAFEALQTIACQNGIQEIIWDKQIWTDGKGVRPYNGVHPHHDHVHIGLNKCGAEKFDLKWVECRTPGCFMLYLQFADSTYYVLYLIQFWYNHSSWQMYHFYCNVLRGTVIF